MATITMVTNMIVKVSGSSAPGRGTFIPKTHEIKVMIPVSAVNVVNTVMIVFVLILTIAL
jgi:hypothetical protein